MKSVATPVDVIDLINQSDRVPIEEDKKSPAKATDKRKDGKKSPVKKGI